MDLVKKNRNFIKNNYIFIYIQWENSAKYPFLRGFSISVLRSFEIKREWIFLDWKRKWDFEIENKWEIGLPYYIFQNKKCGKYPILRWKKWGKVGNTLFWDWFEIEKLFWDWKRKWDFEIEKKYRISGKYPNFRISGITEYPLLRLKKKMGFWGLAGRQVC